MAVAFLSAQRSKDPNKQASWVPPGLQSARSWVNDQQLVEHGLGPDSCRPMTHNVKDPPDSNSSGLAGDRDWFPRQHWSPELVAQLALLGARCCPSDAARRPLLLWPGGRLHRGPEQRHLRHWIQRLPPWLRRQRGVRARPSCLPARPPSCLSRSSRAPWQRACTLVVQLCPLTARQHEGSLAWLLVCTARARAPTWDAPYPLHCCAFCLRCAAALGQEVGAGRPAGHKVPLRVPRGDECHTEQKRRLGWVVVRVVWMEPFCGRPSSPRPTLALHAWAVQWRAPGCM